MSELTHAFSALLAKVYPAYFSNQEEVAQGMKLDGHSLSLTLPFVCKHLFETPSETPSESQTVIHEFLAEQGLTLSLQFDVASVLGQDPTGVKNIIAVASGKGGVGKSTTAVALAFALQKEGAKVGILDADVYGPSIPTLLKTQGQRPQILPNDKMLPITVNGIQSMSIGYLVEADSANVWRGPMASRAFHQLYSETQWQDLDYLIVDMPPGTGDIQLTLSQQMPVTGALVVTTPQDLSMVDAIKGIEMFNKVNVPNLGVVENMSFHVCTQCGHKEHIFGKEGAELLAQKYAVEVLQRLPLSLEVSDYVTEAVSPAHTSQVEAAPDDAAASKNTVAYLYRALACKVALALSRSVKAHQQIPIVKL